jgi:expansin (peptidoglycan-binding protein)
VKVGDGAFMKTPERARLLATTMIAIGRAAGVRVNAVNKTPINAMFEAALAVANLYGQGDLYVCSATDWDNIRKDLANVSIIQVPAKGYGGEVVAGLEYSAIRTMGPKGKIDVLCDPDCPTGRAYMLTRETIKIASMGELVQLIGDPMMEDQADAWESRFVTDSEIVVDGHGCNATVQLATGA